MAIKLPKKTDAEKPKVDTTKKAQVEKKAPEPEEEEIEQEEEQEEEQEQEEEPAPKVSKGAAIKTEQKGKNGPQVAEAMDVPFAYDLTGQDASLHLEVASTVNLGDYNSLRVGIAVTLPVPVTKLDEAMNDLQEWIDGKMQEMMPE